MERFFICLPAGRRDVCIADINPGRTPSVWHTAVADEYRAGARPQRGYSGSHSMPAESWPAQVLISHRGVGVAEDLL